jgi:hypothetical protein
MLDLSSIDPSTIRLLPGKVMLDIDPLPDHIGSLFIPDSARVQKVTDISHTGVVVAIGYGEFYYKDENKRLQRVIVSPETHPHVGNRVVFRLLMSDLNEKRITTDVRRIDAVVE